MYNSRKWPYVSHFEGTNRIIEHIEKYVAPTITSTDLTGQPAFQFKPDDRPRAVFLIGEDEYKTETTLPAFARKELEPLGVRCTFVIADPKTPHDFQGLEALNDADLLVLSVRRRAPTAEQMAIIRKYIESGKPLVGIRTACHAFDARGKAPAGHAEWKTFDPDVLGGHYTGHHANDAQARDHHGQRRGAIHRSSRASRPRSPARARSTRRARWPLGAGALDGDDPGPAVPSRSPGSTCAGRRGSSTRRWATPAISRTPRSAACSATPSSGRSTASHGEAGLKAASPSPHCRCGDTVPF